MTPPRRSEAGFTLLEVMIALFISLIVLGALASLFITGSGSTLGAQQQSQLLAVADQQIEKIREQVKTNSGGFAQLGMSTAPAAGTSTTLTSEPTIHTDPNFFVKTAAGCGPSAEGYTIRINYDDTTEGTVSTVPAFTSCPTSVEPLVIKSGTGIVAPGPFSRDRRLRTRRRSTSTSPRRTSAASAGPPTTSRASPAPATPMPVG